jgi:hypothetical protein
VEIGVMGGPMIFFLIASVLAVFSIPLVMFAILMRLVGRIGTRTLVVIMFVDAVLFAMGSVYWGFPSYTAQN